MSCARKDKLCVFSWHQRVSKLTCRCLVPLGALLRRKTLLKTDYPLRSRDNKVVKNGTVGLSVYLDLEQRKRRERREQAAAARRQQAIDLAITEVGRACRVPPAISQGTTEKTTNSQNATAAEIRWPEGMIVIRTVLFRTISPGCGYLFLPVKSESCHNRSISPVLLSHSR